MTKRGRDAMKKAETFLNNAKRSLDEGDLEPCIHDLFPVCEFAANVLREKLGEEYLRKPRYRTRKCQSGIREGLDQSQGIQCV